MYPFSRLFMLMVFDTAAVVGITLEVSKEKKINCVRLELSYLREDGL